MYLFSDCVSLARNLISSRKCWKRSEFVWKLASMLRFDRNRRQNLELACVFAISYHRRICLSLECNKIKKLLLFSLALIMPFERYLSVCDLVENANTSPAIFFPHRNGTKNCYCSCHNIVDEIFCDKIISTESLFCIFREMQIRL